MVDAEFAGSFCQVPEHVTQAAIEQTRELKQQLSRVQQ